MTVQWSGTCWCMLTPCWSSPWVESTPILLDATGEKGVVFTHLLNLTFIGWFFFMDLQALERPAFAEHWLKSLSSGGNGLERFSFDATLGWACSSRVVSWWRSTRTVSSRSGSQSLANWCRRCSRRSKGWWRTKSKPSNIIMLSQDPDSPPKVFSLCSHRWSWVADGSQEVFWVRTKRCY